MRTNRSGIINFPSFPSFPSNGRLEPELVSWLNNSPISTSPGEIYTYNNNIQKIKRGEEVTIPNIVAKIGLVLINGIVPVTQCSVVIAPYALISGAQFSFSDGTKSAVFSGTITPGTGETKGATLIANGDFASAEPPGTAFTRGAGWTITGGKAVSDGTMANLEQQIAEIAGALYYIGATCDSRAAGNWRVEFTGGDVITSLSTGSASTYHTAGSAISATIKIKEALSGIGTFDNFFVQQVLTADTTGANFSALTDGGVTANSATWESLKIKLV